MTYFDGFGNYGNSTNQKLEVTDGNSATKKNGDSYSGQDGNSTTHSIGNLNSFRRGYSNSLVEGFNFSTTLGASFSTVVGANVPNTAGGKIEMISPFSIKWTMGTAGYSRGLAGYGGYDYDFKSCETQKKIAYGTVLNYSAVKTENFTLQGDTWVTKEEKKFTEQADSWVKEKNFVAKEMVEHIVDARRNCVDVKYTASNTFQVNVGLGVMSMSLSQAKLSTAGTLKLGGGLEVLLSCSGKIKALGAIIALN